MLDYAVAPPERVFVPEGGQRKVCCQYSDNPPEPLNPPIPLPVPQSVWLRDTSTITTATPRKNCSCVVTPGPPLNLTFIDFDPGFVGQYFCRTQVGVATDDECRFEVVLAGKKCKSNTHTYTTLCTHTQRFQQCLWETP